MIVKKFLFYSNSHFLFFFFDSDLSTKFITRTRETLLRPEYDNVLRTTWRLVSSTRVRKREAACCARRRWKYNEEIKSSVNCPERRSILAIATILNYNIHGLLGTCRVASGYRLISRRILSELISRIE